MSKEGGMFQAVKGFKVLSLTKDPEYAGLTGFGWRRYSERWLLLYEASGTIAAAGASDFESASIEVWPFDEVIVEITLDGATTDADCGIRFRDIADAATLDGLNIRDYDTAAILDLAAAFQETTLNIGGTAQIHQYLLDHNLPKHIIRVFAENDDGVNAGTYTVKVYARRLWR